MFITKQTPKTKPMPKVEKDQIKRLGSGSSENSRNGQKDKINFVKSRCPFTMIDQLY